MFFPVDPLFSTTAIVFFVTVSFSQQLSLRENYLKGLAAYRERRWDDALGALEAATETMPQDGPSIALINRIKGLLAGHGVQLVLQGNVEAQLDQVHQWDGTPLPAALLRRLKRAWQQVSFLTTHIQTLEAERRALLRRREDPVIAQVRQLFTLRGIGVNSAWLYVMEFFAWRDFQTPKQVGA